MNPDTTSEPDLPTRNNREDRLKAAEGRVEFWAIWAREAVTLEFGLYARDRKHHWEHVFKAIEMEPT